MNTTIDFGPLTPAELEAIHARCGTLFIGDNGRCTCYRHAGASIRATGNDISGQRAERLTKEQAKAMNLSCESC